jgi:LPS sulfotransferase NodH
MFPDGRSPYPRQDSQYHITQIQTRLNSLRESMAAWNSVHDKQISVRYQEDAQYEHAIGFMRAEQKVLYRTSTQFKAKSSLIWVSL